MAENISVSDIIPARPERVFAAWLDPAEHGKMTGGLATDEGGGRFTAWDGYISGRTVSSVPHSKIVQTWRSTEFPEGAPDSTLTISFAPAGSGTKVTLQHDTIPQGQGPSYLEGWQAHYFTPMKAHFGSAGEKMRGVGEKIGNAFEDATEQVEHAAGDAIKAVDHARARARKQAVKTVQAVKKLGKQVKALFTRKKKAGKPAAKKAAPAPKKKVAAARKKPAPKKVAPKAKPKLAAKKKR